MAAIHVRDSRPPRASAHTKQAGVDAHTLQHRSEFRHYTSPDFIDRWVDEPVPFHSIAVRSVRSHTDRTERT